MMPLRWPIWPRSGSLALAPPPAACCGAAAARRKPTGTARSRPPPDPSWAPRQGRCESGDGQAGVDDLEPEPEVEPEPAPRPVRKKLTKEEKMAKMKEMGKKREAAAAAAAEGDGAAAPQDDAELAIMARCEELFEKYDEDNSGSIDSAEFSALCFDMGLAFEDERVDTIYLLSDGAPSTGPIVQADELRDEVARWNSVRGVVIHCIAVGQDHRLLKGLAEDSGGKYVRVN